jgi:hypothetical protein
MLAGVLALARAALAEARRLDDFIRLYNDLRGGRSGLSVVGGGDAKPADVGGDFILEKQRR